MPKRRRQNKRFNKSQVKFIKNIVKADKELKHADSAVSDTSMVSTSASIASPSMSRAQGDGEDQRVGDQLEIKDIHWRLQIDAGTAQGSVRFYALQYLEDTQPSGVGNLLPCDLFPTIQTSLSKYKILFDKMVHLDGNGKSNHVFNVRVKASQLPIKKINFDSGLTTLTGGGQITGYLTTNNTTASQMTMAGNVRFRYLD